VGRVAPFCHVVLVDNPEADMTDFPHADQLRKTSTYLPASWIAAQITRAGKRGEVETGFFFDDATGTEGPMLRRFLEDHGYTVETTWNRAMLGYHFKVRW